jgi:CRP/FNR family transcriptional regulator
MPAGEADDWHPFAHVHDRHAARAIVRIGIQDAVQVCALHVEDQHGAGVIRPRAGGDKAPLVVQTRQGCTVSWTGGEAFGGRGESELNDQHTVDGTARRMTSSVSRDTAPDWRSLARIPLLATLSHDHLRALWRASLPRRYAAREVLRHVGDPAPHLLLLLRGRVAATATTSAGRTVRFGDFVGPCALDKVAVIDGRGHTATLTALTPCDVRSLPRNRFHALIDDVPTARRHVMRILAGHARSQQNRFAAVATLHTDARLATWLLDEAAAAVDGRVTLPETQESLADLLGVTRVTINRALTRLRRNGLIAIRSRTVDILAPELLRLRASG